MLLSSSPQHQPALPAARAPCSLTSHLQACGWVRAQSNQHKTGRMALDPGDLPTAPSDFELLRHARIASNQQRMKDLGLEVLRDSLNRRPAPAPKRPRQEERVSQPPTRRSLRCQGKEAAADPNSFFRCALDGGERTGSLLPQAPRPFCRPPHADFGTGVPCCCVPAARLRLRKKTVHLAPRTEQHDALRCLLPHGTSLRRRNVMRPRMTPTTCTGTWLAASRVLGASTEQRLLGMDCVRA